MKKICRAIVNLWIFFSKMLLNFTRIGIFDKRTQCNVDEVQWFLKSEDQFLRELAISIAAVNLLVSVIQSYYLYVYFQWGCKMPASYKDVKLDLRAQPISYHSLCPRQNVYQVSINRNWSHEYKERGMILLCPFHSERKKEREKKKKKSESESESNRKICNLLAWIL